MNLPQLRNLHAAHNAQDALNEAYAALVNAAPQHKPIDPDTSYWIGVARKALVMAGAVPDVPQMRLSALERDVIDYPEQQARLDKSHAARLAEVQSEDLSGQWEQR